MKKKICALATLLVLIFLFFSTTPSLAQPRGPRPSNRHHVIHHKPHGFNMAAREHRRHARVMHRKAIRAHHRRMMRARHRQHRFH